MASDIRNLIEEYQNEALFQENQAVQWRGLCTAILLGVDQEAADFRILREELEAVENYTIEAVQDGDVVTITLTENADGS